MRKTLLKSGVLAAVACAMFAPATAMADGPALTLKAEGGAAFPLTSPQKDRFGVGGDLTVKPLLSLTPWLAVGPSFSVLALPSSIDGIDTGTAYRVGATGELRRPHDNKSTGLAAASPWISLDLQYVRTGDLNRFGISPAAGVAVPTSEARTVWVGPFVKYLDVVQSLHDRPGFDNSDAKVPIVGLSIEFGPAAKKPEPAKQPVAELPKEEPKPRAEPAPQPKPDPIVVTETFHGVVQFPYDSAVPLPESTPILKEALKLLNEHADLRVTLEGHASSEGPVKYNEKLAERRAQAVKNYLTKNGVAADRLTIKGFGPHQPVADNKTETGRRLNRRVEYTVKLTVTKEGAK